MGRFPERVVRLLQGMRLQGPQTGMRQHSCDQFGEAMQDGTETKVFTHSALGRNGWMARGPCSSWDAIVCVPVLWNLHISDQCVLKGLRLDEIFLAAVF